MASPAEPARQSDAEIRFDARVHTIEAVKKACYRLSKSFMPSIASDGEHWVCRLAFPAPLTGEQVMALIQELELEVLDQGLRQTIQAETAQVRNTILAVAFSRTGLGSGE